MKKKNFLKVKLLSHSEAGGNDVLVRTDWSAKFERENSIWQRTNLLTYTYTDGTETNTHTHIHTKERRGQDWTGVAGHTEEINPLNRKKKKT